MASRHETVKLRSRNRHVSVTSLPRPEPPALWQLDLVNERLQRGEETIALPPKAFAVLRYLHDHPNRLVTKQELLDAVWPDIAVTEAVLKNCILKLREVLGDDAKTPRYIETVHRRGYRLLTPLPSAPPVVSRQEEERQKAKVKKQKSKIEDFSPTPHSRSLTPVLVGRDNELSRLYRLLEKALSSERQLVFVTGEPGIGKTTLVEAFLHGLASKVQAPQFSSLAPSSLLLAPWLARGQCIEHYGQGEAYLSILSALGQLCREPDGKQMVTLLSQHAPTWLVQMPALLANEEFEALQRKTQGATKERMLREVAEALEVITAEQPLVLVLEDLHWSDPSTLDLLAFVARRPQSAQLFILGTYRPAEILAVEHPLRAVVQELQLHKQCEELALRLLTEAEVAAYLMQRCPLPSSFQACPEPGRKRESQGKGVAVAPLPDLAWIIHQRTEGNPLFMVNVVEDLLTRGDLENPPVEINAPTTIRQMIEHQFERLNPEDQQLIETASVAGIEFSAAAVAAGHDAQIEEVEHRCAALARRGQFLHAAGVSEWPDGTVASRYAFRHALYQEVIYDCVTAAQRVILHRRIGERLETEYGKRAIEIALELAVHFERGQAYQRAIPYYQQAAQNALRLSANQEAITLLTQGLKLLKTLPETPERMQYELTLQLALGDALFAVKGYTAPEVEKAGTRARELCRQIGETPQLFPVLHRLALFYVTRGELRTARELEEQMLRLAQNAQDQYLLSMAYGVLGATLYWLGELSTARPSLERGIALYVPPKHLFHTVGTADPRVDFLSCTSCVLWILGYPGQALKESSTALALAKGLSHPFSLAFALGLAASCSILYREGQLAREQADAMITLATEQEFPFWRVWGISVRGWALSEQGQVEEGIAQMRQGLAAFRGMGTEVGRSHWLALLAKAYGKVGQVEEGRSLLAEALAFVDRTGERWCEAELWRVKGELTMQKESKEHGAESEEQRAKIEADPRLLTPDPQGEAEACFLKAIDVARRQQAKSWELRATVSLARLWRQQGKKKEAHQMLSEIYNWFTEGFDTKDLQEARTLLEELGE